MDLSGQASQARFASYVEALVEVIGHADRAEPLNDYCVGLLMPGERKSVEPMAAIVAPARVSAKHLDLGTGRDSPLSLPAAHDASPTRRLSTPRRRRSVPNATSKTRSRRSENASPSRSQNPSRDVHAVSRRPDDLQPDCVYDTVKLMSTGIFWNLR